MPGKSEVTTLSSTVTGYGKGTVVASVFPTGVNGSDEWHRGIIGRVWGKSNARKFEITWHDGKVSQEDIVFVTDARSNFLDPELNERFRNCYVVPDAELSGGGDQNTSKRCRSQRGAHNFFDVEPLSGRNGPVDWVLLGPRSKDNCILAEVYKLYTCIFPRLTVGGLTHLHTILTKMMC